MGNLSEHDKMVLKRSGFVQPEIDKMDNALTVDGKPQIINLNTEGWRQVLKDREKFMSKFIRSGNTYQKYEAKMVARYDKDKTLEPFDFLKGEYGRYVTKQGKQAPPSDKKAMAIVKRMYGPKWWV